MLAKQPEEEEPEEPGAEEVQGDEENKAAKEVTEKKQTAKKKKDKSESMLDILNNEDHLQKLRQDRKQTIKLILQYNSQQDKKRGLHSAASRCLKQKDEALHRACSSAGND